MKQRYNASFGYKVEFGSMIEHPIEAEIVRMVFSLYLKGHSYKEIAETVSAQGVTYHEGSAEWNKHMVGRILANKKYLGEKCHPPLITEWEYQQVSAMKSSKYTRQNRTVPVNASIMIGKAYCAECGGKFHRVHDKRVYPKWYCKNPDCKTDFKITDATLETAIVKLLNFLIADPDLIQIPKNESFSSSLEVTRLNNEISRLLEKKDSDPDQITSLIMECAAKKYELCVNKQDEDTSGQLRTLFREQKPITEFNGESFEKTVRFFYITKDGSISLQMTNGKRIDVPSNE